MLLKNSFEGGTPGQPITTGNSGGTSGTAFTYVDDGDGAAIYSSTRAAHGSLSCEFPPEVYPVLAWDGLLSGSGDRYVRVYLWIPPDDYCQLGVSIGTDNTDWTAEVIGDESGFDLVFSNYNYLTGQWTGQVDFPIPSEALGQWIRLEFRANNAASGSGEVRLFTDADGTVPAATAPLNVSQPVASWTSAWVIALTEGKSVWIDDLAVSDEGWIGPEAPSGPVLDPPTGLDAVPVSATRIDVSWDAVDEATGYDVQRQQWTGSTWTGETTTRVQSTGLQDTSVSPSTRYRYRVRSVAGG